MAKATIIQRPIPEPLPVNVVMLELTPDEASTLIRVCSKCDTVAAIISDHSDRIDQADHLYQIFEALHKAGVK